jgi:hypothetical protein
MAALISDSSLMLMVTLVAAAMCKVSTAIELN